MKTYTQPKINIVTVSANLMQAAGVSPTGMTIINVSTMGTEGGDPGTGL